MEVPRFREIPYCFSLCQRAKFSIIISTDRTNLPKVKETVVQTSLVIQWLRICLPVQGTWIQSLAQEDSTCLGATKPMCHNYGVAASHSQHLKKVHMQQWRPSTVRKKKKNGERETWSLIGPDHAQYSIPQVLSPTFFPPISRIPTLEVFFFFLRLKGYLQNKTQVCDIKGAVEN